MHLTLQKRTIAPMDSHETLRINGLSGKKTLEGILPVGGSKNAALPILAASLLTTGEVNIENMPNILDIRRMHTLLEHVGATAEFKENISTLSIPEDIGSEIEREIGEHMRASIILTAPLLARTGEVQFPHPGGCVIGKRPIDLFLSGFQKLGAEVKETDEGYHISAPNGLTGTTFFFPIQSHTATETLMMAATLADGTTVLENASTEPEIVDVANFLNKAGASIEGAGTHTIVIRGTGGEPLASPGTYSVIPDRLEAGSFFIIAALSGRNIEITNCNPGHLTALLDTMKKAGVAYEAGDDVISISGNTQPNEIFKAVSIKTHEYPGFPTDLQAPFAVFLTQATGKATIFETIFEGRLAYAESLSAMGADINVRDSHYAHISGPQELSGTTLKSPDIRAGLAYITAALVAEGESIISNLFYIDRGYESIEKKLQSVGANVERITDE